MKFKNILLAAFTGFAIFACNKHEIIPAPEQRVKLDFHFQGYMRGTFTEFTQNVDGFDLETNKTKTISPNSFSRATYYSMLKSSQKNISLKLLIGEALWDGLENADPDINAFTDMFKNYPTPKFSSGASMYAGNDTTTFDIEYKDVNGNIWIGDTALGAIRKIEFTYLSQESDVTGDYMKYIAKIDIQLCRRWWEYHYDNLGLLDDSSFHYDSWQITDGILKGWFKR